MIGLSALGAVIGTIMAGMIGRIVIGTFTSKYIAGVASLWFLAGSTLGVTVATRTGLNPDSIADLAGTSLGLVALWWLFFRKEKAVA